MQNQGLLFIPDISGFTRFINETEIDHSRLIIQELLEGLINANEMGLEISEIEGDAILFYKFGQPPALDELYKQVEKMFRNFHKNLVTYDTRKYCQCKACLSASELTLKIITHYGEFTGYNVKSFSKLIGKDVIVAHQLLKNDIEQHEYWLVTQNLLKDKAPMVSESIVWEQSSKQTENGEIPFHYAALGKLKEKVASETSTELSIAGKVRALSLTREYPVDHIRLFHASGDFNCRNQWMEGVNEVREITHVLPRVGMSCIFVTDNGEKTIYSSGYSYQPERIEFSETDTKSKSTYYYNIEIIDSNHTRLTIAHYLPKNWFEQLRFNLFEKNKMLQSLSRSMEKLGPVAKKIHLPE